MATLDFSVLKEAIALSNIPFVANFLNQAGASINNIVDSEDGSSLLHIAVHNEQIAMSAYLIAQGIDVNLTDQDFQTPLHIACFLANSQLVNLLIENGADIHALDNENAIPADYIDEGDTSADAKAACAAVLEAQGNVSLSP